MATIDGMCVRPRRGLLWVPTTDVGDLNTHNTKTSEEARFPPSAKTVSVATVTPELLMITGCCVQTNKQRRCKKRVGDGLFEVGKWNTAC
jgi:hypothetical protein